MRDARWHRLIGGVSGGGMGVEEVEGLGAGYGFYAIGGVEFGVEVLDVPLDGVE